MPRWLTRKEELADASVPDLYATLLTADGRGEEFKRAALDELVHRFVQAHHEEVERLKDEAWEANLGEEA